jgi:TolB-like protein
VLLLLAGAGWTAYRYLQPLWSPSTPALSIVVLPFDNLSKDPAQDYFADGLTEDVITDLSRIPGATVIARNTSFTYKGKPADVRQVVRDLNVRYVLEGSVQRQGDDARVTVQLIDGRNGAHLWAEQFDRTGENSFAWQNEVTGRVSRALNVELVAAEGRRSAAKSPGTLRSLDYTMLGRSIVYRGINLENMREAISLFTKAVDIDPDNDTAWAGLAVARTWSGLLGPGASRSQEIQLGRQAAERAVGLNPMSGYVHFSATFALLSSGQPEKSIEEAQLCIAYNRNQPSCYQMTALALTYLGRPEESFTWNAKALQLSPRDPYVAAWHFTDALAHLALGQDKEAIAAARRSLKYNPGYSTAHAWLAAAHANLGEQVEARQALAEYLKTGAAGGHDTVAKLRALSRQVSNNPTFLRQRERLFEGLRKAGLPEE